MSINFDHTSLGQRVLFGTERAAEHAVVALGDLDARRVLLIGDHYTTSLADEIAAQIPVARRIQDVVQHVPVENGRAAVAVASESDIDAVLAIGGGSATGLAKIVARDTGLPIVAVPTTFAGSEATNVWGETEGGHKTTGVDQKVLPRAIVYDASLSRTLPSRITTASALNAVAHAIDSYWAPRADPINIALGTEGLTALVEGLRMLNGTADDVRARETILYGAYLAAVAFASAGSGMHHKICHVLGGAYSLSHAEMHAMVLPYVAEFNGPAVPDAARRIGNVFGVVADDFALAVADFRDGLGITGGLKSLGLAEEDIPQAARLAAEAIPPSNPRPFTVSDVEHIIREAWAGGPISGRTRGAERTS